MELQLSIRRKRQRIIRKSLHTPHSSLFLRDRLPDTPHPFLDDPASAPLGWGLNRGHYAVRLSGQDVERGTFGQRNAVLCDQADGAATPLTHQQ